MAAGTVTVAVATSRRRPTRAVRAPARKPARSVATRPPTPSSTRGTPRSTDRPDTQADDHEATVTDCVRIGGRTGFVNGAEIVSPEFGDPQLLVDVTVRNRDERAQPYNTFNWRIQTADGRVLDPTIPFATEEDLGSGDLVPDGEVSGKVAFDVGPGTYYVIWKPEAFDSARGIWEIEVS
ncbi:MAG: DUF4352 domain-containing protein [Acidimicrobiia bacterium]|nr:DUF4352 domain-containing protein [Acidimicrobiia bacterium]